MERSLKENYESLYTCNLDDVEKNLDRFIEAKHEQLKNKNKPNQKNNK